MERIFRLRIWLGRLGNVKISIEYANKDAHTVNVNGKNVTLYTPFTLVCGTMIDNKVNRNISVSNGKVIDDGSKTMVMGICLPGMQESLGISKSKFEVPSGIEISMDTTGFELGNIITFATPKVIEEDDLEVFDKLDELYNSVDTLASSANLLEEGASSLKDGASTYYEKSKEFNSAMKQVSTGASSANSGYAKIDNGISSLNKSSSSLKSGAKAISDGTSAINSNLKTVSDGLGALQEGTETLQDGVKQVSDGIDLLAKRVNAVSNGNNADKLTELNALISANTSAINGLKSVNANLDKQSLAATDVATKESIAAQKKANLLAIGVLEKDNEALNSTINTLKNSDASIKELSSGISQLQAGMKGVKGVKKGVLDGTQELIAGEATLKAGVDTLYEKSGELASGASSLYDGTTLLAKGTQDLSNGSSDMKKGLSTLSTGASSLTSANNQLTDGAGTLLDGASTLSDGVSKFNQDGIKKLCGYINGDLKDVSSRLEKLQELANEYDNFTMLSDGNQGTAKFIMVMDGIHKEENSKETAITNDNRENDNEVIKEEKD